VADVIAAVDYIESEHPEAALILVGHSMGGGVLQRALGMWEAIAPLRRKPAGVVLLASAPLSGGGMDVARRWQAAEAALVETQSTDIRAVPQDWLTWLRSILTFKVNTGVDTVPQVRNKFFSDDTPEESIIGWLQESKSRLESVRVSLESFWPFADPAAVLGSIDGEARPQERKLLVVSGERDVLISKDATAQALDAYYTVYRGQEEILHTELAGSAHHLMLDIAYEQCADVILRWMQGDNILQT
jgi:pimeloyl-ACP methyl ester carboxylesterase